MEILLDSPTWDSSQYELIDSGDFMKLERFGVNVLIRPEPQALWRPSMLGSDWRDIVSATFERSSGGVGAGDFDKGNWAIGRGVPEQWYVERGMSVGGILRMRMGLTSFKHVGIFPEQAANWDYLQRCISAQVDSSVGVGVGVKVLNLFAYTGGASIISAMAGAEVTHLDSVKAVNLWARVNAEASGIGSGIRYITDDAMEFTARELRRGSRYNGIILDPPAYGRGNEGQKWILEDQIYEMLCRCRELLSGNSGDFVLLSLYSMGFSSVLAATMLGQVLGSGFSVECGELCVRDGFAKNLPLGVFVRATRT